MLEEWIIHYSIRSTSRKRSKIRTRARRAFNGSHPRCKILLAAIIEMVSFDLDRKSMRRRIEQVSYTEYMRVRRSSQLVFQS